MAGRRWAQGRSTDDAQPSVPRPSERGQTPKGEAPQAKRTKARQEPRPARTQPSEEAIARAMERLKPPPAPWHPLPLAEAAIVIGFLAILLSAVLTDRDGIFAGFLLIMLGTAEFSWREHSHGFRPHATVLGAIAGFAIGALIWRITGLSRNGSIGVGLVVFLIVWSSLDRSYVPASGRDADAKAAAAADDTPEA